MFRLQVYLNSDQAHYLAMRAEREGVSMAKVVRRILDDRARQDAMAGSESLMDIVGLITDELPLIDGIAVSDDPDLYLYGRNPDSPLGPVPTRITG